MSVASLAIQPPVQDSAVTSRREAPVQLHPGLAGQCRQRGVIGSVHAAILASIPIRAVPLQRPPGAGAKKARAKSPNKRKKLDELTILQSIPSA